MHQEIRHRAPREHYVPRTLIQTEHGRYGAARAYGKSPLAERGRVTLPEAWSTICPNRITKRRTAAGMEFVTDLQRAIGVISYQRLIKMETGRVIIRESEYELVADALGIHEDDLKLPPLTHDETILWNRAWGPTTQIEEGGDEDSVVLAAYVRHLVSVTGRSRTAICLGMGVSQHALIHIWYAEKPIDRWPDSTMMVVMRLAGADNWDEIITRSRTLRADGILDDQIAEVVKPRVRYAPEDPDRKAPWTYETDPLRTRTRRRQVKTLLSAPITERAEDRERRLRAERRQQRTKHLATIRSAFALVVEEARNGDQRALLEAQFPEATRAQIGAVLEDTDLAAQIISRVALIRAVNGTQEQDIAGEFLGISGSRVRQLKAEDDGRLSTFLPKTVLGLKGGTEA